MAERGIFLGTHLEESSQDFDNVVRTTSHFSAMKFGHLEGSHNPTLRGFINHGPWLLTTD